MAICEQLLDEQANGLQWTLGISVSIRPDSIEVQTCGSYSGDDRLNLDPDDEREDPKDTFGQMRFQPRVLNMLIRCIIRKVPRNRLKYFQ